MNKTYKILFSFFLILMSGMGFSQSVPSYVPTNGLVGWWGFNGNAQDGSGNGNHGTVTGATLTTDRFGNQNAAYSYSNSRISINSTNLPLGNSNRSFSLWFQASQAPQSSNVMLFYGSTQSNQGCGLSVTPTSFVFISWINNDIHFPFTSLQTNVWNKLVAVYESNVSKLYLNGVHLQSIYSGVNRNTVSGPLHFGFDGGSQYFFGKLDDIGIWNRALTQQEITNLYNSQVSGVSIPNLTSCLNDTTSVTISHPTLTGVANASLRMTYNPDSLTYVGFNSLNPAFSGMTISGGNGVVLMNWGVATNQTITAGNMVNLRFRVNGNSNLSWDTVIVPSEFYDSAYNLVSQTFSSGSVNHRTTRLVWNRNICEGQSFTLGNQSYTTSGTYHGRRFGTGGACDTLITLYLNVLPRQTNPSVTICSNQPYLFNGLQLNSSGVYLDTLVNILGCDSIVQLNLTVNPVYNQNLTMTICAGGSLQFGSQNLTVAGNYNNTFVSSRGCDSLVNLSLNVSNSTTIVSSNGQNGFCPNDSVRIGLAIPIPNAIYSWRKDGAIIPNATSDTLYVNQAGNYQLAVQVSPTCVIQSNTLTIGVLNCNRITGDLRYDNNNQTPLVGIPVHLKSLLGNIVASDTTDSSGSYDMAGYANGNYLLDAAINYTYGGVNSTDALQVTRFFTSLVTLSPLRIKVGDVNGSGITNSGDALLINRRITGLITSFSVGNFVNNLPSVNALGNPLVANLRALSTGDVNGTYNPQPTAPILVLDTVIAGFVSGTATVRFTSSGSGVFERGVCWGTSTNPTVSGNKMVVGSGGYGFSQAFSGGMVGNQLYYVRAYAKNSLGISYSSEKTFTTPPGQPCSGVSTVTDIDGNFYQGIQIGNQCWTQSNLKTSRYRNGDYVQTGLGPTNPPQGQYSIYNNDTFNDSIFGKLYNHYAVMDMRGLCPTGWKIPTISDWKVMAKYLQPNLDTNSVYIFLGNPSSGGLQSTQTQPSPGGWTINSLPIGTNYTGFSGLPGGESLNSIYFQNLTYFGGWWTSSFAYGFGGSASSNGWNIELSNNYLNSDWESRHNGYSIRCLRDSSTLLTVSTYNPTTITSFSTIIEGSVTSYGGTPIIERGMVYKSVQNPTSVIISTITGINAGVFSDTIIGLNASTQYSVRAFATNFAGTIYGNEVYFTTLPIQSCINQPTVSDIDGNVYNAVQIGNQCWTQSNLKTSRYRNGDNIPTGLSNVDWENTNSGAYAIYNNDPVNDGLYGKLYNHYAVTDSRGLCPTGWHVPSDGEWKKLIKHLDPRTDTNTTLNNYNVTTRAGGILKETIAQPASAGWMLPNIGAVNSIGFSGLPGGNRSYGYNNVSHLGTWWSSTRSSMSTIFFSLSHNTNLGLLGNYGGGVSFVGNSVRCLKD
ncbi:MAG: hypothetical protein LW729_02725 [Bacteroidetes bacterium]|jgi:uncharacterized protein (TIGR02145 family)|nr:hypothetical protein [Bacteroidota bacterium]